MNEARHTSASEPEQGVQYYKVLCLVALLVILLVLMEKGAGLWSLLCILLGVLAVLIQWSAGPVILLLSMAACLYVEVPLREDLQSSEPVNLPDFLLCTAALVFVAGHSRLRSLTVTILPPDPRVKAGQKPRKRTPVAQRRSDRLVSQKEIGILVISLPVWPLVAQVLWKVIPSEQILWKIVPTEERHLVLQPGAWKAACLVWILGLTTLVAAWVMDYWSHRQMSPQEATLFLQDVLWQETRREQRRLHQWLAWAKLRLGRKP